MTDITGIAYKRPPITEAVVEIRFSSIIETSILKKLSKKFERYYSNLKPIENHSLDIKVINGKAKTNTKIDTDYRLSSQDMSQIIILKKSAFTFSQIAPYEGWSSFISRFERDWKLYKKHTGHHQIARIGVRYINRIDIPKTGPVVEEDEYLNIYPEYPKDLSPLVSYAIQSRTELKDIKSILTINSAVVKSPLPNHISIVVDQDIGREMEPPQSTEDVFYFMNEVRIKKNSVFESCITDKARELFNK